MVHEPLHYVADQDLQQYTSPDSQFIFPEDAAALAVQAPFSHPDTFWINAQFLDTDIAPLGWSPCPGRDHPEPRADDDVPQTLTIPAPQPVYPPSLALERRVSLDLPYKRLASPVLIEQEPLLGKYWTSMSHSSVPSRVSASYPDSAWLHFNGVVDGHQQVQPYLGAQHCHPHADALQTHVSYDTSSVVRAQDQEPFAFPSPRRGDFAFVARVPSSCISRRSSLAGWDRLPTTPSAHQQSCLTDARPEIPMQTRPTPSSVRPVLQDIHDDTEVIASRPPSVESSCVPETQYERTSRSSPDSSGGPLPRRSLIDAVRSSPVVRQAANLRIDVGRMDINSPQSHEARVRQRRRRNRVSPLTPYDRPLHFSPTSAGSPIIREEQKSSLASGPDPMMGTFSAADQHTSTPSDGSVWFTPETGPPLQQTFQVTDPSASPDSTFSKKSKQPTFDLETGAKKPFLACGFCRQRKICCGKRASHDRDSELSAGPRTCNQCYRRGILCSYPSESRRGLRKVKLVEQIVWRDGQQYRIIDDAEADDDISITSSKGKKSKIGRPPLEWIIAVDAYYITPIAWRSYGQDPLGQGAPIYRHPIPPRHPLKRQRGTLMFMDEVDDADIFVEPLTGLADVE